MHLDKRQEERRKPRPQVYMCLSREDGHCGARAMENEAGFQEEVDNGAQSSGTARNERRDIVWRH